MTILFQKVLIIDTNPPGLGIAIDFFIYDKLLNLLYYFNRKLKRYVLESFENKKVFFVCPPSIVQEELLLLLINLEFEIYLIKGTDQVRKVMRIWPESVFFFNIDDCQSKEEWDKMIEDLRARYKDQQCLFGIVSYENNEETVRHYLMDMDLPCGFIRLNQKLKESASILARTLDANEVRGRRKYVRYVIPNQRYQRINFNWNGSIVHGELQDISSAAMVINMEKELKGLKQGSVLDDIQLNLSGKIVRISGEVFGFRQQPGGGRLIIVTFSKNAPMKSISDIRLFINKSLQKNLEEQIR